ncbi:MAG: B12-binding domain-containing radical SAM protein [Candidatus Heimdallarchaeota archaeon]
MEVTLINPPISVSNPEVVSVLEINTPPMGLASLAAPLEHAGYGVTIIDAPILNLSFTQLGKQLAKKQPEVIGVTAMTPQIIDALRTISIAKKACPEAVTVLGGAHATFLPVKTLQSCSELDVVCVGEGEQTLLELVQTIEKNGRFSKIRGTYSRDNGRLIENERRPPVSNLDDLPFPARHLLEMDKYRVLGKKIAIGAILTSRGCPFRCAFCSSNRIFGKKFRARSPENVLDEIEQVITDYKPATIEFSDDLFTLNHKRVQDICKEFKKRGIDLPWACSSRVNTVSRTLLCEMKRAGCKLIFYGIESGSQRILNAMHKGITIEQIEKAIKWTNQARIDTYGAFILGWPGETIQEINQTIAFAKKLDLDFSQFSIATPYPGTSLYDAVKEKGLLTTEDWTQFTAGRPIFATNQFSEKELRALLRKAYKNFYLRSKFLIRQLKKRGVKSFLYLTRFVVGKSLQTFFTKNSSQISDEFANIED